MALGIGSCRGPGRSARWSRPGSGAAGRRPDPGGPQWPHPSAVDHRCALLAPGEPRPALQAFAAACRGLPPGPDTGRALLGIADALVRLGRDPRPVLARAATACAGHRGGEVGVLRRLGDAHGAAGDTDAAVAAYRRALPLLDDPRTAVLLGILDGRIEVTVAHLDQRVAWPDPLGCSAEPDAVVHGLARLVPAPATALLGRRALNAAGAHPRTPAPTDGPAPGS